MEVYFQKNISIFNKLFFYQMGPVIDPKMRNLQEMCNYTKYTKACKKLF